MSNARRAAFQLLSREWSRGVWKHWLTNILEPPVEPPLPKAAPAPAPVPIRVTDERENTALEPARGSSCAAAKKPAAMAASSRQARRAELRARFDALSDRLHAVEDGLGTLLRRSAQRDKLDRRSDQQSVEVIDNVAMAAERQATVLEGLLATVSRLEHAVSRLDQGLSRMERSLPERRRDSFAPPAPSQPPRSPSGSWHPESQIAPRDRGYTSARSASTEETEPDEGSGINGHLSEVSLSTVLAMLEIERHSGRLKIVAEDGMLASFELAEGTVVSSRLAENDADPLQTLRSALCWKHGRFWFRQQASDAPAFAPRSIGSLLLEATRQNDESFANVG